MKKLSVALFVILSVSIIFIGCTNVSDFRWDDIPETPVPGNAGTIVSSNITSTSVDLLWIKASDAQTPSTNLLYLVYFSSTDNIQTVSDMEVNGTAIGVFTTNINRKMVSGLNSQTTCYLNVMVKDTDTNKAAYTMKSVVIPEGGLPAVGNSGLLSVANATVSNITITWTKATDAVSPQFALKYLVYYSTSSNISSVADMEANGTAIGSYSQNINSKDITDLGAGPHYFNVLVKDEAGNKACYTIKNITIPSLLLYDDNGSTGGTVPIDSISYTNGQEVTVLGNTESLVKIQDGISFNFIGWTNSSGTFYTNNNTFTMASANVTLYAKWSALREVGPGNGFIFYDKGSYSDGWRYLEAAPSDQSSGLRWYNGSYTNTGAVATAIGTGQENTTAIILVQGAGSYAAQLCNDFVNVGYADWFMPSKDELSKMRLNLQSGSDENNVIYTPVGNLTTLNYWSSSESSSTNACGSYFGCEFKTDKMFLYGVRAIRAF